MNPGAIYSKSGKGVQEASGKTSLLKRAERAVLSAIDGRATLNEVAQKVGKPFDGAFQSLIAQLDRDGFVREVTAGGVAAPARAAATTAAPPKSKPKPAAPAGEDLDFTGIMPVTTQAPAKPAVDPATALFKARKEAEEALRGARFVATYNALEVLYASDKSDAAKAKEKQRITRALQAELDLGWQPNNASLLGFKVYNTGRSEFQALYQACGQRWAPFFAAIKSLKADDFGAAQLEDISSVILKLVPRCQAESR